MSMYHGAQAAVLNPNGEISEDSKIDLKVGVLQGDTLAPFLFILVMDFVLRKAMIESYGVKIKNQRGTTRRPQSPAKYLTDLDFADDIVLFSSTIKGAQALLRNLEKVALSVGLKINQSKSEYILIGEWAKPERVKITIKAGALQQVSDYKYLGSWLENSTKDFQIRRDLAWTAHRRLWRIWKSETITRETKLNIFKATIESILLYNATTWTMTESLRKSLDGTYTKLLRYALNIKWQDRIRNTDLYQNLPKVSTRLQQRRLTFAGHCWRSQESAIQPISDLMFWTVPGGEYKRGKGNCTTYIDTLLKDHAGEKIRKKDHIVAVSNLTTAMEDRDTWKNFVKNISANDSVTLPKKPT
jgi:hypothetical protein